MTFRLRVRDVFDLSGRGTAVVGFIESGEVSVGDELRVEGSAAAATVAAVEGVRDAAWTPDLPPPVGLVVPAFSLGDLRPGDVLVGG